jgi:hypothetical protein
LQSRAERGIGRRGHTFLGGWFFFFVFVFLGVFGGEPARSERKRNRAKRASPFSHAHLALWVRSERVPVRSVRGTTSRTPCAAGACSGNTAGEGGRRIRPTNISPLSKNASRVCASVLLRCLSPSLPAGVDAAPTTSKRPRAARAATPAHASATVSRYLSLYSSQRAGSRDNSDTGKKAAASRDSVRDGKREMECPGDGRGVAGARAGQQRRGRRGKARGFRER